MKITWTDRPDGRQFWEWNPKTESWEKTKFVTWAELNRPNSYD